MGLADRTATRRMAAVVASSLVLALAATPRPAHAQVLNRAMSGPAPFGILLGDVFTLRSTFDVAAPFRLDPASLPKPGAVTYSLDLRSLTVEESPAPNDAKRYEIVAEYQTFYAPLEAIEQTAPPFRVAFVDGVGKRVEAESAGWTYITSPLRPIAATAGGGGGGGAYSLRPDASPRPIGLRSHAIMAAAAAAAALIALALLAWSRAWPPFHRRPARPFARAARDVARSAPAGDAGWKTATLALHRAFDASAGRRLLGEDLDGFLASRPAFARLEPAIDAFFAASRNAFFGGGKPGADFAPDALKRLSKALAAAERAS